MDGTTDPDRYVEENSEELVRIIKHSSKTFPRALALAALVEYGDEPSVEALAEDIEQLQEHKESK